MALELSGIEFEAIKEDFLIIDKDGDGQISRNEMLELLGDEKVECLEFMMTLMDTNDKGTVCFTEFLDIMAFLIYNKGITIRIATQFFRAMDKDNDGALDVDEIKTFYDITGNCQQKANNPTTSELDQLVESLDTDHDGKLDFEEFLSGLDKFLSGSC